jgi:Flp pilus assembly protein TadB
MKEPSLAWNNELEAVKNTRAGLVSSLGDFAYIGVSIGLAFLVRKLTSQNDLVVAIVVIAFYVVVAFLMTFLVKKTTRDLFQSIEL